MVKSFEGKLTAASSAEKLRAAKQLLKHDALTCAWRDDRGIINATFQERNSFAHTQVRPGDPGESRCTSCHDEPGKLCEHAVAALMYCGRFNQEIKAIEDGVSNYAGLKYESLETLSARENPAPTARVRLEASSDFPHVPSKWENAVLTVRLQNADREYLGNVNNLRQLFFEKTLSIALKLSDFSLQDQQIIRFLAINGEPDHSNVLLNSEQTAEFFHCLVGFDRFFRGGKRLFIRGERAEAVILRRSENGKTFLSPGIRVENAMLPIQNAKVITGRAGCWIGKQGEYFFIPASLDVAWLRNFFRTGEHEMSSKISANLLLNGQFPVPVLEVRDFELKKWNCQILLGGFFDAENQFHLRVCYLYDHAVFQVGSGRIARVGRDFIQRDECGELKFENELAMFGFRQNGKVFTLDQAEGSGIFLDKMLPQILSTRNNVCLEAPLARLCRGGNGLPSAELHCSFRERRKDGFLLEYTCVGAGSDLTLQELTAAARSGQSYIPSGSGALVRITPEMRTFLKGASNILLDHHPELHTFVVPYHSVPYFRHLTESLPGAQVRELYLPEYLDFTPPPAEPEFTFAGELRTYQQEGVDWLKKLTDANFNVILADEMGLGKTIQLLALLAARKRQTGAPALVICPASLVSNWEREARRFIPDFRVAALIGGGRENVWSKCDHYDLIVISYATARNDAALLKKHIFSYLILDEAQHIKNPGTANSHSCKAIRADHRIVLTGTPLENSSEDLWSIMDFLHPGMLGTFNSFRRYYAEIRQDRALQEDLAARVSPFMLRRTKADVCAELPPKQERMLFCSMDSDQRNLYETIRENGLRQLARLDKQNSASNLEIFTTLLRLRQVCCHPGLLPEDAGNAVPSAKFELLQELVMEHIDSGHRLLLFSQFTSLLAKITEWLDRDGIAYEYLDGATRNRQMHVDHFNETPEIPLFLLSLKAGGTGLNLTSADTVVICDPWWNPAVELQAADRTHRIGQTRPVTTIKLLVKDSIEEKILALQEQKQEVFDNVIDNPNHAAGKFSLEDLRFLLS